MMEDELEWLQERVRDTHSQAELAAERFQSGAWMLDVRFGPRFFVASFSPRDGYGYDEVKGGNGLTATYSHAASGVNDLFERLSSLMRDPASP